MNATPKQSGRPATQRRGPAPPPALACLALPLLVALFGCQHTDRAARAAPDEPAPPAAADQLRAEAQREADAADPDARLRRDLPLPAALMDRDEPRLTPRTGDDLERARLSFQRVVERLPLPDYLREADRADADSHPAEPPSAAVRAYAHGRAALDAGQRTEAIRLLEQARRLDPTSPRVLRLLGMAYLARGDDARGARTLREAIALNPEDGEVLFLLGRFAYQRRDWDETIVTLARSARAEDQAIADPAIEYLRPYYLAQALLNEGYDAAAISQLQRYLALPDRFAQTTRLLREVAFLARQRGEAHVQIGDARARLGDGEAALASYQRAADEQDAPAEPVTLTARRIYILLAMDRPRSAELALLERLGDGRAPAEALTLVPYLAEHTGHRQRLAELLHETYQASDRPAPIALALAELLDGRAAAELLADHLAHRPDDIEVYHRLVSGLADEPDLLIAATLRLIRAHPPAARRYTEDLLDRDLDAADLLDRIDRLPDGEADSAAAWYLRGALHESLGRVGPAADAYQRALDADEQFLSPQLATAELRLRAGEYARALELIDAITEGQGPDAEAPEVLFARARALAGLDRPDQAARIIEGLIEIEPRNLRYRLFLARLQTMQGNRATAERTLWSILDADPESEEAYAALFDLYEAQTDGSQQWIRLMQRVQREIPESRIARLKMAEWYAANRQFDRAERSVRSVLDENPDDNEALGRLVAILGRADQWDRAKELLLEHMQRRPDDPLPVMMLQQVAAETGEQEQIFPHREAFLRRQEFSFDVGLALMQLYMQWDKLDEAADSLHRALDADPDRAAEFLADPERVRLMVGLYLNAGRHDDALGRLTAAIEHHQARAPNVPDTHGADLYYFRSMVYHDLRDEEAGERALLAALEADPDHPASNNDLGYLWADADRHLDRALEMATKAVEAEPDNSAYLDSLGWVHYKLGDFEEAARWLEQAASRPRGDDPVIVDHLGDAYWRLGRHDDAVEKWREALGGIDEADFDRRPDLADTRDNLDAKLQAVEDEADPPVAASPGADQRIAE